MANSGPPTPLLVTPAQVRELERAIKRANRPVTGSGVRDYDHALIINPSRRESGTGEGGGDDSFLAIITGNATMTGHTARWWYAWTEIVTNVELLPSSGAAATYVSGGLGGTAIATPSGSDLGGAYNRAELLNLPNPGGTSAWYIGGVQSNPNNTTTNYPAGASPRPANYGGTRIVRMRPVLWSGITRYEFNWSTSHDGTCA